MEVPKNWRLQKERYGNAGSVCPNSQCQRVEFFKRDICPECGHGKAIFNSKDNLVNNEVIIPQIPVLNEPIQG